MCGLICLIYSLVPSFLGCSQVGKATGFGPVIHGFESYHPSLFIFFLALKKELIYGDDGETRFSYRCKKEDAWQKKCF